MAGREVEYDGDYEGPPGELYWRAYQLMLRRTGKRALAEIEEALLAMPERRLMQGFLAKLPDPRVTWPAGSTPIVAGDVCVIGQAIVHKRVAKGESRMQVIKDLDKRIAIYDINDGSEGIDALEQTAVAAKEVGIPKMLARHLSERNDAQQWAPRVDGDLPVPRDEAPEERYVRMLAEVRALRAEAETPLPFKTKQQRIAETHLPLGITALPKSELLPGAN